MNPDLSWQTIAIRLVLSLLAGAAIGFDRGEHGRPAGLRTIMLVCLASAVAMIQTNLLLATNGKPADSYVVIDTMRIPLGVLSGMGFIGAGAILHRDSLVTGVTTAATLWLVAILGLCFGGGQIGLASWATVAALLILWGLKKVEHRIVRDRLAELRLLIQLDQISEADLRSELAAWKIHVKSFSTQIFNETKRQEINYQLSWRQADGTKTGRSFYERLTTRKGVVSLEWTER